MHAAAGKQLAPVKRPVVMPAVAYGRCCPVLCPVAMDGRWRRVRLLLQARVMRGAETTSLPGGWCRHAPLTHCLLSL